MSTHDEHRRIREMYERAGLHTRADRLAFASEVVGRRIDWGIQLTPSECAQVIGALEAGAAEPKESGP